MKSAHKILLLVGMIGFGALLSACTINLERNPDGSLTATSTMSELELQEEIELALSERDTLVKEISIDIKNDTIDVTMQRERPDGSQVDEITFSMTLGVSNGALDVTISDVLINGETPKDQERMERWSERIARRLEEKTRRGPNRTLQSVEVKNKQVTMVWHVETRRSRPSDTPE
jgi:hypothetical protein